MTNKALSIFGEVLFDCFPDGSRVLGGAPFNVAWHLQAFGQSPFFISRIGNDHYGEQIRQCMLDWEMTTAGLQIDDSLPTGIVEIELKAGEPSYDIVQPSAYDNIDAVQLEGDCKLLYHGSLALRNQQSAAALKALLQMEPSLVFVDVNLRDPWWDKPSVQAMIAQANWIKLNIDEFKLLYPSSGDIKQCLTDFMKAYQLQGIVLTHGGKGAELMTHEGEHYSVKPPPGLNIIDTVGAGDAFSSIVVMGLKNNWSLSDTMQRAEQFASSIVHQRGATVKDKNFYSHFKKVWGLS